MKLHLFATLTLIAALPTFAAEGLTSVTEGTVKEVDSSTKTMLIATKDGAKRTFHFGERTAVHGVEAVGRGSEDAMHWLKEGSEVVVRYTTKGTVDSAEEIDHIGADGLKATEGTVKKIDRGAKTITIATADGAERTFRLLGHAARDTGRNIEKGADKSARVTVYYTEEDGNKVAHFLKSAF